jgi:hypothetical protein
VKEVTYTPAQLAAREEGKLKHNAACCSQRPSFRIVCGAGNLAQCRILFATVIMQWPGLRRSGIRSSRAQSCPPESDFARVSGRNPCRTLGCIILVAKSMRHWAILPAAAFQATLSGLTRVFPPTERRLKAGGSQAFRRHEIWSISASKTGCRQEFGPVKGQFNRPIARLWSTLQFPIGPVNCPTSSTARHCPKTVKRPCQ